MIEINGQRYDASSGLPLASDFREPKISANQTDATASDEPQQAKPQESASTSHRSHKLASHAKAHPTQTSRVYNRRSVKKPDVSIKPAIKLSKPASHSLPAHKAESSLIKLSTANINPKRAEHASRAQKSEAIRRFSVNRAPAASFSGAARANIPAPARRSPHVKTGRAFDIVPARHPSSAVPTNNHQAPATVAAVAQPTILPTKFESLVEKSERTNNHRYLEYTPVSKRSGWARLKSGQRRAVAFAAIGLLIILVSGFVFYQQKANIELQLADARAGINAGLPGYKPSGFSVGDFTYKSGLVAINFNSERDGHYYKLIQTASNLNSEGLAEQLSTEGNYFETLHKAGQTIYANTKGPAARAAWVSGGILYRIEGNASLSQDDILNIATNT